MKLTLLERRLYDAMAGMEIIDAHDHLPLEREYVANQYCGLHMFAGYIWCDLMSSGIPMKFRQTMRDPGFRPVDEWWPQIKPYWDFIKHSSYAKPLLIAARDFYGIDDINDRTIHILAERVFAENKPGIYNYILRKKCNIRAVLNNPDITSIQDHPLLRLVPWVPLEQDLRTWDQIMAFGCQQGVTVHILEDLLEALDKRLNQLKAWGAVGFKALGGCHIERTEQEATTTFNAVKNKGTGVAIDPLYDFLFWKVLDKAAQFDIPVALHCGVWDDFRNTDPKWVIPLALARPNTRLDLFHLGAPFTRDALVVGKNHPNVTLNLCWVYVFSEKVALSAIDELIDLVPLHKVSGFGADYVCSIQKTYGHLVMTRETLARVLAGRVKEGDFSEKRAVEIAKMWLHDNPARIYRV